MNTEDSHLTAAVIAAKLRDAGVSCEIINLVSVPTSVLRRDRIVIILALSLLTVLTWSYVLWLSADMSMGDMDMTGLRMIPSGMGLMMPADMPWHALEFAFVCAMWTVMMVGMMTPSTAPMMLMYARMGRQTGQDRPLVATVWFAVGYFLVWIAFAPAATLVQWALERTALLDFRMATTSDVLGGLLFVTAGLYQWTRLNEACLAQCRKPFEFMIRHGGYRCDAPGSVTLGLRQGAYCVGCCWTLMAPAARRWHYECALDRHSRDARLFGTGYLNGPFDRSPCWRFPDRGRSVVVLNGDVLTARTTRPRNVRFWHLTDIPDAPTNDRFRE